MPVVLLLNEAKSGDMVISRTTYVDTMAVTPLDMRAGTESALAHRPVAHDAMAAFVSFRKSL